MIAMMPFVFLMILAFVAVIFAIVQDWRTHEVANWISFSLIIFALGFRIFYSFFNSDFGFLYQGLIGLGVFFILGNLFYYGKIFAGGDAKLMIALGTVLPFYNNFNSNLSVFAVFVFLFLISGAIYGIIMGMRITILNWKVFVKDFYGRFKKNNILFYFSSAFAVLFVVLGFFSNILFLFGIFVFIIPYLYVWAKSVDESCMIRTINPKKLREGDWLYKSIRISNKTIKAKWEGLTKEEISILRKRKTEVAIREGIPFTPVFLLTLILLIIKVFFLG